MSHLQPFISVTARRISPSRSIDLLVPKKKRINVADIKDIFVNNKRPGAVLKLFKSNYGFGGTIETFETVNQIQTLMDPTSSNPTAESALAVTAAGTTQGTATALSRYYNVVTIATLNQGVVLPNNGPMVIVNNTAVNIKVYPAVGNFINELAVNLPIDVPAFSSVQLAPKVNSTTVSLTAVD